MFPICFFIFVFAHRNDGIINYEQEPHDHSTDTEYLQVFSEQRVLLPAFGFHSFQSNDAFMNLVFIHTAQIYCLWEELVAEAAAAE